VPSKKKTAKLNEKAKKKNYFELLELWLLSRSFSIYFLFSLKAVFTSRSHLAHTFTYRSKGSSGLAVKSKAQTN